MKKHMRGAVRSFIVSAFLAVAAICTPLAASAAYTPYWSQYFTGGFSMDGRTWYDQLWTGSGSSWNPCFNTGLQYETMHYITSYDGGASWPGDTGYIYCHPGMILSPNVDISNRIALLQFGGQLQGGAMYYSDRVWFDTTAPSLNWGPVMGNDYGTAPYQAGNGSYWYKSGDVVKISACYHQGGVGLGDTDILALNPGFQGFDIGRNVYNGSTHGSLASGYFYQYTANDSSDSGNHDSQVVVRTRSQGDAAYNVYLKATSNLGHQYYSGTSVWFGIDGQAPTIDTSNTYGRGTVYVNTYDNGVTIGGQTGSGLKAVRWAEGQHAASDFGGGNAGNGLSGGSTSFTVSSTDWYTIYAVDNVGNETVKQVYVTVDTTPPSMTFSPYSASWTNQSITVTMTPYDSQTGVNYFQYRTTANSGASWSGWSGGIAGGASGTVTLSNQGIYNIQTYEVDNAGNAGYANSGWYYIDKTPPTCAASASSNDWRTGASPVTLTYSDDASGVASRQYSWSQSVSSPGSWQSYTGQLSPPGSGVWYLWWRETDVAGNVGTGHFGPYTATAELTVGVQTPNAAYLTDTDVITSVRVSDGSAASVFPGDSAVLNFTVIKPDGTVYTAQSKAVVCPANDGNLLWFRWHTPTAAGTYTLKASLTAAGVTPRSGWGNTLSWNIKVPIENAPPQTTLYDKKPSWFSIQTPNPCGYLSVLSWSDWIYTGGAFQKRTYSATLNAALTVTPTKAADGSNRIVTAVQDASGQWTLKSGYGISESVTSGVTLASSSGSAIDSTSATAAQLTEGRYPEFNYYYAGYFRLFDRAGNGGFQLKQNPYSQYGFRTHYVPIWFPDGTYMALATVSQAWTPAGMLGTDTNGAVQISGALPDDWYVKVQ